MGPRSSGPSAAERLGLRGGGLGQPILTPIRGAVLGAVWVRMMRTCGHTHFNSMLTYTRCGVVYLAGRMARGGRVWSRRMARGGRVWSGRHGWPALVTHPVAAGASDVWGHRPPDQPSPD